MLQDCGSSENTKKFAPLTGKGVSSIEADKREVSDLSGDGFIGTESFAAVIKRMSVKTFGRVKKKCIRVRARFLWPMDRPLIPEFSQNGFTWNDILCCALHADMRLVEWYVYHTVCYSQKPISSVNAFLTKIGAPIQFKRTKGKLEKITFHQHSKAKWWFEEDRWQQLVEFCDGVVDPENPSDTWAAWSTYAELRELLICMHPSTKDRARFKELTLDFFVAYRLKFSLASDVNHYIHHMFAHGTMLMDQWKSLGAFMLQAFENLHSDHKDVIQKVHAL